MEVGAYGRLGECHSPDYGACLDVPGYQPGPRFARRVWVPQPSRPFLQRPGIATSRSITEPAIWDQLAREGKRSIIVGVPPGYPPRRINGLSVSCFLTPDTAKNVFTHPPELSRRFASLVGHYPVDVQGFRTDDKKLAPRSDLCHEPHSIPGGAPLAANEGLGLLPLCRHRPGPDSSRLLEVS